MGEFAARSPTEAAHPAFTMLEDAVRNGRPLSLTVAQCRAILEWVIDITERKNDVVRENWKLVELLDKKPAATEATAGPGKGE